MLKRLNLFKFFTRKKQESKEPEFKIEDVFVKDASKELVVKTEDVTSFADTTKIEVTSQQPESNETQEVLLQKEPDNVEDKPKAKTPKAAQTKRGGASVSKRKKHESRTKQK